MMDHNEFDFMEDLIQPFYNFLKQLNISLVPKPDCGQLKFPEYIYLPPANQRAREAE